MNELIMQALLYDFYGELLTPHQRMVYEDYAFNDLSLGEIAEQNGISRQGVHDLIKRCEKQLASYEERLHLVARFSAAKEKTTVLGNAIAGAKGQIDAETYEKMQTLLEELKESL